MPGLKNSFFAILLFSFVLSAVSAAQGRPLFQRDPDSLNERQQRERAARKQAAREKLVDDARAGGIRAQAQLGDQFAREQDMERAEEWWKKSAAQGDESAALRLRLFAFDRPLPETAAEGKALPACLAVTSSYLQEKFPENTLSTAIAIENKCAEDMHIFDIQTGDAAAKLQSPDVPLALQYSQMRVRATFTGGGDECRNHFWTNGSWSSAPGPDCRNFLLPKGDTLTIAVPPRGFYAVTGFSAPGKHAETAPVKMSVQGRRQPVLQNNILTLDRLFSLARGEQQPVCHIDNMEEWSQSDPDCMRVTFEDARPSNRKEAQLAIGDLYDMLGDAEKAAFWWQQAEGSLRIALRAGDFEAYKAAIGPSSGYPDSCYLGAFYARGQGAARDMAAAYKNWGLDDLGDDKELLRRAENGYPRAQLDYGLRHLQSYCAQYVPDIKKIGMGWIRKAAESGNPPAQYKLGLQLRDQEGLGWLRKAAEAGYAPAQSALGHRLKERDEKAAESWFLKAARQGDADAQEWLARLYMGQWGKAVNEAEAYFWFTILKEAPVMPREGELAFLRARLTSAQREAVERRVSIWRPDGPRGKQDFYLPKTSGTTFVPLETRLIAERDFWNHLFNVGPEYITPIKAAERQIRYDLGAARPSPPAPQTFEIYRKLEFSGDGTTHLVALAADKERGKDMVSAVFSGAGASFAGCRKLLEKDVPAGRVIGVSGTGRYELVLHDQNRLHGLRVYDLQGPVTCALKTVKGLEKLQAEELARPGEIQDWANRININVSRYLEFTAKGTKARLVGRSYSSNVLQTEIVEFGNTKTPGFAACKPLMERQLPEGRSLVIRGKGNKTSYRHERVDDMHVYKMETAECELSGDHQEEGGAFSYQYGYKPARRGADREDKVPQGKMNATPHQIYDRYLEQGAVLAGLYSFKPDDTGRDILRGSGRANVDNSHGDVQMPQTLEIIFDDPDDPLLRQCRPLLSDAIPAGQELLVYGYGTSKVTPQSLGPHEDTYIYSNVSLRLRKLLECRLKGAEEKAAEQAIIDAPGSNLYVASMKIGGAIFWLRYTQTTDKQLKKADEADESINLLKGTPSANQAWKTLAKAGRKSKEGNVLGDIELTVEGNAATGAAAVEKYAKADSAEHQYMLGLLYYHGVGVKRDPAKAYDWMQRGVEGGMGPPGGPNPFVSQFGHKQLQLMSDSLGAEQAAAQHEQEPVTYTGGFAPEAAEEDMPFPDMPGGPEEMYGEAPVMPSLEEGLNLYPPPYPPE